jgi:RND superfamily putative drug exporter
MPPFTVYDRSAPPPPGVLTVLERFALFCFRRRRAMLGIWLVLLVGLGVLQGAVGSSFRTEFRLPSSESKRGFDTLEQAFPGQAAGGMSGTIVFRADQGVTDPAVKAAMSQMFDGVAALTVPSKPGETLDVQSPYAPGGERQIASSQPGAPPNAEAGKIAYANVNFPQEIDQGDTKKITSEVEALTPHIDGLQVELGGEVFAKFEAPSSETIGLVGAIFILLLAFGSVLAMGLPIGVALFGIGTGIGIITLASHVTSITDITTTISAMIGLGVGIDYALFIVTRYREGLHNGLSPEQATVTAISTAGRAVIFAGITVVISLLGMLLMGLAFVNGIAIGASVTVLMTMLASVTLLPALLGFAQRRVEVTRWRGLIAVVFVAFALLAIGLKVPAVAVPLLVLAVLTIGAGFAVPALRREVPRRAARPMRETFWFRWSRLVQHRPWPMLLAGLVVLVVMAVPVLSLRLGSSDTGNYPADTTTRKAYDLTVEGFGPGFNGPLLLAARLPAGMPPAQIEQLTGKVTQALSATPGVVFASPVHLNDPAQPTAAQWTAIPSTSPQDEATSELVHHLRDDVLPEVTGGTPVHVDVTGSVAANIDFADYLSSRMPLFLGAVLALSFLLLMAVFRSVLVPLKAVVMNLLSIGAAYGVVVAVFQWGWAKELVGIGRGGPIEAWAPMMMFAIVFGLSMDYEVFLLSRMREEWDRTGDNATSVADGLAATARVITAAAGIMVVVFGSFLLDSSRQIKLFGMGLAIAVLLDATIVRMVLVPSTMELLGRANWWIPRWLDRLLPRLNVEGHAVTLAPEAVPPEPAEEPPVPVG